MPNVCISCILVEKSIYLAKIGNYGNLNFYLLFENVDVLDRLLLNKTLTYCLLKVVNILQHCHSGLDLTSSSLLSGPSSPSSSSLFSLPPPPHHHLLYSQWLASRNTSLLFGLQGGENGIVFIFYSNIGFLQI